VSAYVDFAAAATRFVDGGPAEHLTTLFPPVRPRGRYLEVRFLDAQETTAVGEIASTLAGILYDPERRRRVLRRLEPLAARLDDLWVAAASGDLADGGRSEVAA
jgi:glutamate--cysteine ligase